MSTLGPSLRGIGIVASMFFGVLVVGWLWQFVAYQLLVPTGAPRWLDVRDPQTMLIAYAPLAGVGIGLIAVAAFLSIRRRTVWQWPLHLVCWAAAIAFFAFFTFTSIVLQLSLTGLTPAH